MLPWWPFDQHCILLKSDNFKPPTQASNKKNLNFLRSLEQRPAIYIEQILLLFTERAQGGPPADVADAIPSRRPEMISWMGTAVHKLFAEHTPSEFLWHQNLKTSNESNDWAMHPFHYKPDLLKAAENHSVMRSYQDTSHPFSCK